MPLKKDPRSGNEQMTLETHKGPMEPEKITLWEEHDRDVHWWNLSVDLNSCTGLWCLYYSMSCRKQCTCCWKRRNPTL